MSKHSQPTNRTAYITKSFRPNSIAEPNSRGASTEGEWLRAEADSFLADGVDIVIAEDPKALQALTYRCNILAVDKVVYPL